MLMRAVENALTCGCPDSLFTLSVPARVSWVKLADDEIATRHLRVAIDRVHRVPEGTRLHPRRRILVTRHVVDEEGIRLLLVSGDRREVPTPSWATDFRSKFTIRKRSWLPKTAFAACVNVFSSFLSPAWNASAFTGWVLSARHSCSGSSHCPARRSGRRSVRPRR